MMDLVTGFEIVPYVTNPYSLMAFFFLSIMIVMAMTKLSPTFKIGSLVLLAGIVIILAFRLAEKTALATLTKNKSIHLVRGKNRIEIHPRVEICLNDIETLKGKKNWEFNRRLDDVEHIFDQIIQRAGITSVETENLLQWESDDWQSFMVNLEKSENLEEKNKAEKIKDIPFASFTVYIDGKEREDFRHRWFFKRERLEILDESNNETIAIVEVENIYNTRHQHSGEPEAVNIRVVDS